MTALDFMEKYGGNPKKIQKWMDIIQDVINLTCIVVLWIYVSTFLAIIVGIYEFIRVGAYFSLATKLKNKVMKEYMKFL